MATITHRLVRAGLHLPGVIMAENGAGERRFLLPDGLGSVRQASDETGMVVAYYEFDPYGKPLTVHGSRFTPSSKFYFLAPCQKGAS